MEDLKRIIEALLFASPEPLSLARIKSILRGVETGEVTEALEALREEYAKDSRSFQMVEIGGGYQLATKSEYSDFVARLVESHTKQRLSRPAMETLAVVAYKQPVVRSSIESIRGVNVDGVLRTLMERNLIRIVGRGDGPGRPLLFGTTREFLMQFGLNKLSDLPGLKEIEELVGGKDDDEARTGEPGEDSGSRDEEAPADETDGTGEASLEAAPSSDKIPEPVSQSREDSTDDAVDQDEQYGEPVPEEDAGSKDETEPGVPPQVESNAEDDKT